MKFIARAYPRRGLHGELVHRLGLKIVSGEWEEGTLIATDGDFGTGPTVSRAVARETVRVLASKGLIDARQNLGTTVRARNEWRLLDPDMLGWMNEAGVTPQFVTDLTELRESIEPRGAYYAAQRATQYELGELTRLYDAMTATTGNPSEFADADVQFHAALLSYSHNELLSQLNEAIAVALLATRRWLSSEAEEKFGPDALRHKLPGHAAVLHAVASGAPSAAYEAMHALIAMAQADLEAVLDTDRETAEKPVPRQNRQSPGTRTSEGESVVQHRG